MLRLILLELRHRAMGAVLAAASIAVATALVVAGLTWLRQHRERSNALVAERLGAVQEQAEQLEDAMRRITKKMGFNVLITPKGQNLDDPFADDYASKFMPEDHADRLAAGKVVTVNHLLPSLEQRVTWPERGGRTLFLIGIKGQVPVSHEDRRQPIVQPVPEGGIVVGSSLAESEGLKAGDAVVLRGEAFKVVRVEPRRGDKRDLSAWIPLKTMQRLAGKPGLINAIWALQCNCAMGDVGKVREELARILPDVHVEEQGEKALARAEARKQAHDAAEASLRLAEEDQAARAALVGRFQNLLAPALAGGCAAWVGLLAWGNVRERRAEIGVFRAVGLRSRQIMGLVLARAAATSVAGAGLGVAGAAALVAGFGKMGAAAEAGGWAGIEPGLLLGAGLAATVVSLLASSMPALLAARVEPADALRHEG